MFTVGIQCIKVKRHLGSNVPRRTTRTTINNNGACADPAPDGLGLAPDLVSSWETSLHSGHMNSDGDFWWSSAISSIHSGSSLSLSFFLHSSLPPLPPISTTCHLLTLFLCLFFFLPSPLSLPSWAAELTAHLALTHRAHSELGEINSDKHCTWLLY